MTAIASRSARVRTVSAGDGGAAAAGRRKRKRTESHERVIVTGLVAFGLAVSILGSMRVAGDVREARAREAMTGTFVRVHERQSEFRRVHSRFATYAELSAKGLRLPGRHQVRKSTASGSHWYLSIRDRNTGIICDRTGELTDETGRERPPVCRSAADRGVVASADDAESGDSRESRPLAVLMKVAGGLGGR